MKWPLALGIIASSLAAVCAAASASGGNNSADVAVIIGVAKYASFTIDDYSQNYAGDTNPANKHKLRVMLSAPGDYETDTIGFSVASNCATSVTVDRRHPDLTLNAEQLPNGPDSPIEFELKVKSGSEEYDSGTDTDISFVQPLKQKKDYKLGLYATWKSDNPGEWWDISSGDFSGHVTITVAPSS